jgi:ABC-type transport system substrate-binding protein
VKRRALCVASGLLLLLAAACGDDEPQSSSSEPDAEATPTPTTTTTAPASSETSDPATVTAVLASRLRGEYPGIHDTRIAVDGDELQLEFDVGEEETPGDARAFGVLAAQELQTIAPETLDGIDDVRVTILGPDGPVRETYLLEEVMPGR